jgi:Fic family protein
MRTYESTHPWISFHLDLSRAPAKLWLALGEAQSKCDHIAGVPLRPQTAEDLHITYFSKGVQATAAIEGNTFTEEEVRERIAGKSDAPPSKEYQAQEIDNLLRAFGAIMQSQRNAKSETLTVEQIKSYNRSVLAGLTLEDWVVPGEVASKQVGVPGYRGVPPDDAEFLLDRLCEWLNSGTFVSDDAPPVVLGLIRAILAHVYLAWIHAFGDGNGRTARLVEFQLLVSAGVPTPAAHLLSNHYNQTRSEYYRQLRIASESGGDIIPFMLYAAQGFVDGLRHQLKVIRDQQWDVAWENYIYDSFRTLTKKTDIRRRHLVLDLSSISGATPAESVRRVSPRVAEAYAGKTHVTMLRDLKALEKMNLIEITDAGVRAKREIILAFLPLRRLREGG